MEANRVVEPLTRRQREVLDLLVRGRTNYEIAQSLGISLDGAKWHVREVLARLGVESREQAAEVWRHERSWLSRARGVVAGLLHSAPVRVALIGTTAAGVSVAVAGAIYVGREDDPPADPIQSATSATAVAGTPTPSPTSVDDLAPDTDNAMANKVIEIATTGDLAGFRQLMVEFPEPCTTGPRGVGSPLPCPPGASAGDPQSTHFGPSATNGSTPGPISTNC